MTAITPVSQYDGVALARSAAGERMMMEGGATPLATLLQKLVDRTEFAKDAVIGNISWNGDFAVDAGGTLTSFTVRIGAINAAVILLSSTYKVFASSGTTIGASKIEGGGATLTAAAQWWYVYAYSNAGTLDYEISTTAPGASRMFKTGDFTRAYLGCFRTLSSGAPIPVVASRGHYVYDVGGSLVASLAVVMSGTSATYASVPCSTLAPPHARIARLSVRVLGAAVGVGAYVDVQSYGSSSTATHRVFAGQTNLESTGAEFDVRIDSSQRAQYLVAGGGGTATDISVYGFLE